MGRKALGLGKEADSMNHGADLRLRAADPPYGTQDLPYQIIGKDSLLGFKAPAVRGLWPGSRRGELQNHRGFS